MKDTSFRLVPLFVLAVLICVLPFRANAAPKTWTGTGNWQTDTANWTGGTVPVDGDDVIIDGTVTNTASTANLASYTLNAGRTHVFDGWTAILTATVVTVNGTITHNPNTATSTNGAGLWVPDKRVYIVCSNLTVGSSGQVNADASGYQSMAASAGRGPGGGGVTDWSGGGGYGAVGGNANNGTAGGITYGSSNAPTDPGSSGGAGWPYSAPGGAGGGAVLVQASGAVTVNGAISASGNSAAGGDNTYGGGSGGGIYITCSTFGGSGVVRADGGTAGNHGGGGYGGAGAGGRIAIIYNGSAQQAAPIPSVTLSAGSGLGGALPLTRPPPGTVYVTDNSFFPPQTITNSCNIMWQASVTNWAPGSLRVSNAWAIVPGGVRLGVTNDVRIEGSDGKLELLAPARLSCGGNLAVTNGSAMLMYRSVNSIEFLSVAGDLSLNNGSLTFYYALTNPASLTIGGNVTLTNSAKLYLWSGTTNGVSPRYGGLFSYSGKTLTIPTNCAIYPYSHPTNGGSLSFVVGGLTVAPGGSIDAEAKGFNGNRANNDGFGPGAGHATDFGAGGGYGGFGGNGANGSLGSTVTYGSSNAPVDPGSAGGHGYPGTLSEAGGGLVWVTAGRDVRIDGTIKANGISQGSSATGGGAGGGIYISCRNLSGGGSLQANGGNGGNWGGPPWGGGGGGGRVAVWRMFNFFTGTMTANAAANSQTPPSNGTVRVFDIPIPEPGMLFQLR